MRLITLTSLTIVTICLAACGSDPTLPGNSDLSSPAPDFFTPRDAAAPVDFTLPAGDLTSLADLTRAPDLTLPGGGGNCGGFIGKPCPNGEFCEYPESCGGADESGTCLVKPMVCDKVYSPVCGCDGKLYGNDCERRAAGVSLRDHGICGCPMRCGPGSHCADCKLGPACIPNGAAC